VAAASVRVSRVSTVYVNISGWAARIRWWRPPVHGLVSTPTVSRSSQHQWGEVWGYRRELASPKPLKFAVPFLRFLIRPEEPINQSLSQYF
jgi:hypothetical protein